MALARGSDAAPAGAPRPEAIRRARTGDVDAIIAGLSDLQEVLRALHPALIDGPSMARAYYDDLCSHGVSFFVYEDGARIVGLVAVEVRRGVDTLESTINELARVTDLWIAADRRRTGVGRALLLRAEEFARAQGLGYVQIESLAANVAARETYLRAGFQEYVVSLRKKL